MSRPDDHVQDYADWHQECDDLQITEHHHQAEREPVMDQRKQLDVILAEESARKAAVIRANEDQVLANAERLDPANHSERAKGLREAADDIRERREWAEQQAFAPFLFGELGEKHRTEQAQQLDDTVLDDTNLVAEPDRAAWARELHESLTRADTHCDRIDAGTVTTPDPSPAADTARTEPAITAAPPVHQAPDLDRGVEL